MAGNEASAARMETPESVVQPIPTGVDLDALDRAADGIRPSWVAAQPAAHALSEVQVLPAIPSESAVIPMPASLPPPGLDVFAPLAPPSATLPSATPPSVTSAAPIVATASADLSGPWTPSPDITQPLGPVPGLTSISTHPVLQPLRELIIHRPKLALLGAGVLVSLLLAMVWPSSKPAHSPAPPAPPAALAVAHVPPPPAPPAAAPSAPPEPSAAAEPPAAAEVRAPIKEAPARAAKSKRGAAARSPREATKPAAAARLASPKVAAPKKPVEAAKPAKATSGTRQSLAPNPYR